MKKEPSNKIEMVEEEKEVMGINEENKDIKNKNTATVEYKGRTRTFTKEIHGKDFKKLAESFAKKFDGKIK